MPLLGTRSLAMGGTLWAALYCTDAVRSFHAASDSRALAPGRRQGRGGCGTLDTRRPNSDCGVLRPCRQCCAPNCRYKVRLSRARVQRKKTWPRAGSARLTEAGRRTRRRFLRRRGSLRFGSACAQANPHASTPADALRFRSAVVTRSPHPLRAVRSVIAKGACWLSSAPFLQSAAERPHIGRAPL